MTTEELNTIVQAVIDKINEQALDFDVLQTAPESTDLLTAVRPGTNGAYQGVTLKWDDVANAVTREAKGYRDEAQTAKDEAASAKTDVKDMKASVEQTVSDFNILAEEKKVEVQGVYQTDLNDLKADLDDLKEMRCKINVEFEHVNAIISNNGYYLSDGSYGDGETFIFEVKSENEYSFTCTTDFNRQKIGFSKTKPVHNITLDNIQTLSENKFTVPYDGWCILFLNYGSKDDIALNLSIFKQAISATNIVETVYNNRDEIKKLSVKKPYMEHDISLLYDIDNDGRYTKGWLKLPSNYSETGKKVPLVIFVHGSACFTNINSPMTYSYDDYYNYIRDCGYAIFDCYAFGSEYYNSGEYDANTFGLPTNRKCYMSGLKYVIENYNIDENNIFVSCKSLGGIQALSMYFDDGFSVKAVGMLAPALDTIGQRIGYSSKAKKIYANELGFSEATNGELDWRDGENRPSGFNDYLIENAEKFSGWNPYVVGLNNQITDTVTKCVNRDYESLGLIPRFGTNRGLKIWVAPDDEIAIYPECKALIDSLRLTGMKAELREMPIGTGGHHSVDNHENAPQMVDVTTRLGIHYDSIPTAYYELVQFFDTYCTD